MLRRLAGLVRGGSPEENAVGCYVDLFREDVVLGWAWRPDAPQQRVHLEFLADGTVIGEVVADRFREDLKGIGGGDGHYAFEFRLPPTVPPQAALSLRVKGEGGRTIPLARDLVRPELHVELFRESVVAGWAWRADAPQQPVHLEFLANDAVIGEAVAHIFRDDLKAAGKGEGCHAFLFQMPAGLATDAALGVRVKGEPDTLLALAPEPEPALLPTQFSLDTFNDRVIEGWAWRPHQPQRRLHLEFLADDTVIGESIADVFRADLAAAGKGDGGHAFTFPLPLTLYDGRQRAIGVRRKGSAELLHVTDAIVFGRIRSDMDIFAPDRISGSAWIVQQSGCALTYGIVVDGVVLEEGWIRADQRIEWSGDITALLLRHAGAAQARLRVELHVQGQLLRAEDVEVDLSPDGRLAIAFDTVAADRIDGRLLMPVPRPLRLWIDGRAATSVDPDRDGRFSIPLAPLQLADGERTLQIGWTAEAQESICRSIDYRRFICSLDIADGVIAGRVRDGWTTAGSEAGIEVRIDDHPVAVVIARETQADRGAGELHFQASISQRWRDGTPHAVQCRLIGPDRVFPDTPLLFHFETVRENDLTHAELMANDHLGGWAVTRAAPSLIADVVLSRDGEELARVRADAFHPALAADSLVPVHRGFDIDLSDFADGVYGLDISFDGRVSARYHFRKAPRAPFQLQGPGHGRDGLCFVLPDLAGNVQQREEARAILLAAAAAARGSSGKITLVIVKRAEADTPAIQNLQQILVGLIGNAGAAALKDADFTLLPAAPLPSTIFGPQKPAYELDLWLRANAFSRLVTGSHSGIAAYCVGSRRQGLNDRPGEIVVLIDSFAIVDTFEADQLLARPELLFDEAFERAALKGADRLIAPGRLIARRSDDIVAGCSDRVEIVPLPVPDLNVQPAFLADADVQWLVFAGPLQAASGVVVLCDALDRLARRPTIGRGSVGVVFAGPEDRLRGRHASAYIRERAAKWPFRLHLFPDLAWDTCGSVLAGFARQGAIAIPLPQVEGTAWDGLAAAAGLRRLAVDQVRRPDNATDLADALEAALTDAAAIRPAPERNSDLGARLSAPVPSVEARTGAPDVGTAPLVSVCISHFNRPALLRQTLASLSACNYPNFEVVIVDDGSTLPGMQAELAALADEFNALGCRIITQRNSYLGAVRNAAARAARGDLIIFMDDDNLAHPDMIDSFVRTHLHTGAEIVTARFGLFDGSDLIDPAADVPGHIGVPLLPDVAAGVLTNCFGDANMLITRAAFDKIGGFTEDYGRGHEDWELLARAALLGIPHELLNRACFWYRVAANSMLRGRETEVVDLQRNIRAYRRDLPDGMYRLAQLAQGLVHARDKVVPPPHLAAGAMRDGAGRLAFGRVAVIMRTRNRPLLLRRAIESVVNQTYADWVLVIVNDGGDPEPVRRLVAAQGPALDGRILLINNPVSTGMENASNAGITNSTSEFVVIHDDDDAWDPRFLERCVNHLDSASVEVGGVITHATVVVEDIQNDAVIERDRFLFSDIRVVDLARLSVENQFPPITFLFRRSVMTAIGQFDGKLPVLGDWDFHLRVAKRFQIDVLCEPLAFYHHRVQGTAGDYGNTVVAARETHRTQRALFVNAHMREALNGATFKDGELLYFGELHRDVTDRLQEMKTHMARLERLLGERASQMLHMEDLVSQRLDRLENTVAERVSQPKPVEGAGKDSRNGRR